MFDGYKFGGAANVDITDAIDYLIIDSIVSHVGYSVLVGDRR